MKTIPLALLNEFKSESATLATCWLIELADGTMIRGTDHDEDVTLTELPTGVSEDLLGTYQTMVSISASDIVSNSDMAVDNMEVNGKLASDVSIPDLTVERIESGVADKAPVTVFMCNWEAPDDGIMITRRGYLGEFTRTTDGGYRTEVRGLAQLLSQTIGGTMGTRCSVKRLGDAECKFNVAAVTRSGVVTAVMSRRAFTVALTPSTEPPTDTYFSAGVITFGSGSANDGFLREVKRAPFSTGGTVDVELWDEAAADVEVGDAVTLEPGCDRTFETCDAVFGNLLNFRGYGIFIPGMDELMAGPVTTTRAQSTEDGSVFT